MGDDGPSSNQCVEVSDSNLDQNPHLVPESNDNGARGPLPLLTVVISPSNEAVKAKEDLPVAAVDEKKVDVLAVTCHEFHSRSESNLEECRVCQQQTEESLMDLGCKCRGELSKVHKSCILIWFRTKGSNKCEICQQVAINIPLPDLQPSVNYCVWRVDSAYGTTNLGQGRTRGCVTPLWVAFAVLIGGLLLDVLLSILLGVSALPVNIIIAKLTYFLTAAWATISIGMSPFFHASPSSRNPTRETLPVSPQRHSSPQAFVLPASPQSLNGVRTPGVSSTFVLPASPRTVVLGVPLLNAGFLLFSHQQVLEPEITAMVYTFPAITVLHIRCAHRVGIRNRLSACSRMLPRVGCEACAGDGC